MTNDEFLRALALAITQQEDLNDRESRDILFEVAARIYGILLRELPEDQLSRTLQFRQLRAQVALQVVDAQERIATLLLSRITATERLVTDIVREFYELGNDLLPPRPIIEVLDNTLVVGQSVSTLFASTGTGLSPFSQQLLRLFERSVNAGLFTEQPTRDIAERVISTRGRGAQLVFRATRGTIANAWRERLRAITGAALWGLVTPAQVRANAETSRATSWRWNAILDPRTCPICRPLHNTVAATPFSFPLGPPPLHPRCRCVLIPIRG